MNDKIEKLLNELGWGMGDPSDDCMQCSPFDPYKFAEMIVRECAEVAADHDALDIYEEIREHFGVES